MRHDREGIALVTVILTLVAVASVAVGGFYLASTATVINANDNLQGEMEKAADAALEEARARINASPSLYPASGYSKIEDATPVYDAAGSAIPGLTRTVYVGPTGLSTGQYGVFGSIVAVVEAPNGTQVIRRLEVFQESFAKYAYFTNFEGTIYFTGGDQIFGPVHSNDDILISGTGGGPTFFAHVTTAAQVSNSAAGDFREDFTENAPAIPMPTTQQLTTLEGHATQGNTAFGAASGLAGDEAELRLWFRSLDVDGDGENESFLMAYRNNNETEVVGQVSTTFCGAYFMDGADTVTWQPLTAATYTFPTSIGGDGHAYTYSQMLQNYGRARRSCLLGGDPWLDGDPDFEANDGQGGQWVQWPGTPHADVTAAFGSMAQYLYPLTRKYNPTYKGVIHVDGQVAISGTVRGMHTIAATDNIVIVDDLQYDTNPGSGLCRDMLGIFSGQDVVMANNSLNPPVWVGSQGQWMTFDDTRDETVHAVILALDQFYVHDWSANPDDQQWCEGSAAGRGCLRLTGGIIQERRGPVGLTSGEGYKKRYSYDTCVLSNSPPYFPTTGHFNKGRFFEVDPTGFDIATYFNLLNGST